MKKNERAILKQYLKKDFPNIFYNDGYEELVFIDSIIAGYCSQLLHLFIPKNVPNPLVSDDIMKLIDDNIENEEVKKFKNIFILTIEIIERYSK